MIHRQTCPPKPILLAIIVGLLALFCSACLAPEPTQEEIEAMWAASAHADTEAPAFSNWNDRDPAVISESCAKCHSTSGYHDFLGMDGATPGQVDQPVPVGESVECDACHNDVVKGQHTVVMPSGAQIEDLGESASCSDCHQGRASTVSVQEAIGEWEADTVNAELEFINIHNNAVAAMVHGAGARSGYEYADHTYAGFYDHVPGFNSCTECHSPHSLEVEAQSCSVCHLGAKTTEDLKHIRMTDTDYDGDGDISEGIAGEIETMSERLLLAMQIYAARGEGTDRITYVDGRPYFAGEDGEGYSTWTPRLFRAAYNYHYAQKGAGAYAHNAPYVIQLLYDSLEDMGAAIPNMSRP